MQTYLAYVCIISLVVVIGMSGLMILWPKYRDGVFGKLVLIVLSITAFAELERCVSHSEYHNFITSHAWMYLSIALLQVRHFWRFIGYTYHYKLPSWFRGPERREVQRRT